MEVVQVDLASCLKLVDEIEKMEGEGSARARPKGWKPLNAKQLNTAVASVVATKTIGNLYIVYTRHIKKCEADGFGGERTGVVNTVTKLVGCA